MSIAFCVFRNTSSGYRFITALATYHHYPVMNGSKFPSPINNIRLQLLITGNGGDPPCWLRGRAPTVNHTRSAQKEINETHPRSLVVGFLVVINRLAIGDMILQLLGGGWGSCLYRKPFKMNEPDLRDDTRKHQQDSISVRLPRTIETHYISLVDTRTSKPWELVTEAGALLSCWLPF